MIDLCNQIYFYLAYLFSSGNMTSFLLIFFPFVVILEMPYYVLICLYSIKAWLKEYNSPATIKTYAPFVTVVITCYNETFEEVLITVRAIAEQIYSGNIQTLIIIDNAQINKKNGSLCETTCNDLSDSSQPDHYRNRKVIKRGTCELYEFRVKIS